jgi:hypothetical protein
MRKKGGKRKKRQTENAEKDQVSLDLTRRIPLKDHATRVILNGRIGGEVVGIVPKDRIVAAGNGKRCLVLLQSLIRFGGGKESKGFGASVASSAGGRGGSAILAMLGGHRVEEGERLQPR